jgi:hypothetical protein
MHRISYKIITVLRITKQPLCTHITVELTVVAVDSKFLYETLQAIPYLMSVHARKLLSKM